MLTTDQKGAIAEMAIARAALELGVGVSRPLANERYDLVFDVGSRLLRVQCKWVCRRGDVVVLRCYSARRNADGLVRRTYGPHEVDAFAAYCDELERCYLIPFDHVPRGGSLQLRLAKSQNNQQIGLRWAARYELAATLAEIAGP
jgi:hypothetical protein